MYLFSHTNILFEETRIYYIKSFTNMSSLGYITHVKELKLKLKIICIEKNKIFTLKKFE
jgi:hypothetical protein